MLTKFMGANHSANDDYEARGRIWGIPSSGDRIEIGENLIEVDFVIWPMGSIIEPIVYLKRDEHMTDAEWADVFTNINLAWRPPEERRLV